MIEVSQDQVPWPEVLEHPRTPFLVDLHDPLAFVRDLPAHFQPPTQKDPQAGLPPNVWVGMTIPKVIVTSSLFDVRARIRWVRLEGAPTQRLGWLLKAWRCPNCGTRGLRGRSLCPHAKALCGDVRLEPQLHWLRGDVPAPLAEAARSCGILVDPSVPVMKQFREFRHGGEV